MLTGPKGLLWSSGCNVSAAPTYRFVFYEKEMNDRKDYIQPLAFLNFWFSAFKGWIKGRD